MEKEEETMEKEEEKWGERKTKWRERKKKWVRGGKNGRRRKIGGVVEERGEEENIGTTVLKVWLPRRTLHR